MTQPLKSPNTEGATDLAPKAESKVKPNPAASPEIDEQGDGFHEPQSATIGKEQGGQDAQSTGTHFDKPRVSDGGSRPKSAGRTKPKPEPKLAEPQPPKAEKVILLFASKHYAWGCSFMRR